MLKVINKVYAGLNQTKRNTNQHDRSSNFHETGKTQKIVTKTIQHGQTKQSRENDPFGLGSEQNYQNTQTNENTLIKTPKRQKSRNHHKPRNYQKQSHQ